MEIDAVVIIIVVAVVVAVVDSVVFLRQHSVFCQILNPCLQQSVNIFILEWKKYFSWVFNSLEWAGFQILCYISTIFEIGDVSQFKLLCYHEFLNGKLLKEIGYWDNLILRNLSVNLQW